MISIVFNANNCFLLDDQPNWSSRISVDASLPASYERGLTGKEVRRPMGDTLRITLKYTAILTSTVPVTNLRNSLQAYAAQQILCPFWPAGFLAGAAPTVTAAYYVLFNSDGSFNSVQASAAQPFALLAYPLMVGILSQVPDPQMLAGGMISVDFEFTDNDNYPLTMPAFVPPAGLNSAGGVRPLFPFLPDWSTLPHSGDSDQDVDRRQIGATRTLATAYYTQRGRRSVKQFFTLVNYDAFNLLSFFAGVGGEQNNFWLGAALNEANLTANVAATDVTLTIDHGANLGTNSFILLGNGVGRVPLVVSSVLGNVWTLSGAVGTAFTASQTGIESLVLARFDALKITLSFTSPQFATSQIQFKELPWETNAVAGETYGTTMGALPVTASFFLFSMTTPSNTTYWRFTSYERNLSDGVNTWTSAPMEYDNIVETADLKRNSTTLTSRNFAGNPLALLFPLALEWPLMLQIYEGDITPGTSTVGNLRCYFYGEVGSADMEPPFITAECNTLSHIFDRQIPRRLYQRTDNWALFEAANGLLAANWQWNAVVVSYNAATSTLIIGTITSTNGATLIAHYFAAGYLIITSATLGTQQVRMIGDSLAPVAGQMTLSLATVLGTAPAVGDVVNLFPGYDGQAATAIAKFNNYPNFGGFPFIPVGNPSVLRITQPTGAGKK